MTYELTVIAQERNPGYADYLDNRPRGYGEAPPEFLSRRVVAVELTQAEYDAVRKALIAHWQESAS